MKLTLKTKVKIITMVIELILGFVAGIIISFLDRSGVDIYRWEFLLLAIIFYLAGAFSQLSNHIT